MKFLDYEIKKEYLGILIVMLIFISLFTYSAQGASLEKHAQAIIKTCVDEEYRPGCYDTEIPRLMDTGLSMEEAYIVTRHVQERDDSYFYCHILGHNLSAKETAKDPSKWKEVVARSPSGMCSNGGIHGAFQERFRAEALPDASVDELKPILSGVCQKRPGWNPTSLEQATCTHALGHLAMYVTGGNIDTSIELCSKVALDGYGRDLAQICFDGAFMQIFQPLEPEDIGLVEDIAPTTKDEALTFCSQYSGRVYGSCYSESWPLSYEEIITPHGLEKFCKRVGVSQENRCYNALFYVVTAQFTLDEERITNFCKDVSSARRGQCFSNAASRLIETDWRNIDTSVRICKTAQTYGVESECYNELVLYSTYNFHPRSDEFFALCNSLPAPWGLRCLHKL